MTSPAPTTEPVPDKGPIQFRPSPEGRVAIEWLRDVLGYTSLSAVLEDFSEAEAIGCFDRAMAKCQGASA